MSRHSTEAENSGQFCPASKNLFYLPDSCNDRCLVSAAAGSSLTIPASRK